MSRRLELVVANPEGLHARPAGQFVEAARRFEASISLEKDGRRGNAKSLVSVLRLGITKDARIVLEADGVDEEAALDQLSALIDSLEAQ
jgi:phosphocarrier protein